MSASRMRAVGLSSRARPTEAAARANVAASQVGLERARQAPTTLRAAWSSSALRAAEADEDIPPLSEGDLDPLTARWTHAGWFLARGPPLVLSAARPSPSSGALARRCPDG